MISNELVLPGLLGGAAQNGQLEIVHYLVSEIKLKSSEDRFNRDPATLAQANGHQDVSDYLQSNN